MPNVIMILSKTKTKTVFIGFEIWLLSGDLSQGCFSLVARSRNEMTVGRKAKKISCYLLSMQNFSYFLIILLLIVHWEFSTKSSLLLPSTPIIDISTTHFLPTQVCILFFCVFLKLIKIYLYCPYTLECVAFPLNCGQQVVKMQGIQEWWMPCPL